MSTQMKSSVIHSDSTKTPMNQYKLGNIGIITFLIIVFFVIKTFIYIKDTKRHGK